jgi:glycyl-tRNA synthetase alpha subunit
MDLNITPNIVDETPSQEEIVQHYEAALHSVNLINKLKEQQNLSEEDKKRLIKNVKHLKLMVNKTFWKDQNINILSEAINKSGVI